MVQQQIDPWLRDQGRQPLDELPDLRPGNAGSYRPPEPPEPDPAPLPHGDISRDPFLFEIGLRTGDVVEPVDGKKISDLTDAIGVFRAAEARGEATLAVLRDDVPLSLPQELQDTDESKSLADVLAGGPPEEPIRLAGGSSARGNDILRHLREQRERKAAQVIEVRGAAERSAASAES